MYKTKSYPTTGKGEGLHIFCSIHVSRKTISKGNAKRVRLVKKGQVAYITWGEGLPLQAGWFTVIG